jgi:hypothetical protein
MHFGRCCGGCASGQIFQGVMPSWFSSSGGVVRDRGRWAILDTYCFWKPFPRLKMLIRLLLAIAPYSGSRSMRRRSACMVCPVAVRHTD